MTTLDSSRDCDERQVVLLASVANGRKRTRNSAHRNGCHAAAAAARVSKGVPMFGFGERYNYDRFTREMMDPAKHSDLFDDAPAPGERAPDFEARTLNGDRVQLSDYRDEK